MPSRKRSRKMGNGNHPFGQENLSDLKPRMVTIYQLMRALYPYIAGYPWAPDALMDLWLMGAPSPNPVHTPCPSTDYCFIKRYNLGDNCDKKYGCARARRLLLPTQFALWWTDVAARHGTDKKADEIYRTFNDDGKPSGKKNGGR